MKRVLSLILVLALALGGIPFVFAADMMTATAGEQLKALGLVEGDANGLREGDELTRAEMMVLLARLLGQFDDAKAYKLPSASTDVAGHWAANYIAYAELKGWTAGVGNNKFAPDEKVSTQMAASFMLKALGYDVNWETAVADASAKGLMKDVDAAAAMATRGNVFTAMMNTLAAPMKDSTTTLAASLNVTLPTATVAGVKVDTAKALSFKLVEVALTDAATAVDAASFKIADKDGAALEVKAATLIDSKTVWLDTVDQAAGKVYTLTSGDVTAKFTGVAKDTLAPSLLTATSKVMDNVTVLVKFDKELDARQALNAANYSIDNNLQVTKAEWNLDSDNDPIKKEVVLTTSAQTEGKLYTLTASTNLVDLAGNAIKSSDDANQFKFGGMKADSDAPELTSAMGVNAVKVTLTFNEPSGLTKATAEDIANYTIINKTTADKTVSVVSAELVKDAKGIYNTVELKTTSQIVGNTYEVAVANVADKFGNVISTTSDYKTTFSGQPADTTGPKLNTVEVKTNTQVKLTFNEDVDKATAETVANYVINNNLTAVSATQDADSDKVVWLVTSSQTAGTTYKVTVNNVLDEYNNKIGSTNSGYFAGLAIDDEKPTVVSALATVVDNNTYVTVKFSEDMNETTAKVASNYFFGSAVGYGIDVTKVDAQTYKVRTNALEDGKTYTVTVTGAEDMTGNVVDSDANEANFAGKATADTEAPEVVGAFAVDKQTIKVLFSRAMSVTNKETATVGSGTIFAAANCSNVIENPNNYILVVKDDTTNLIADYSKVIGYAADDKKSVTLRFQSGSGVTLQAGKVYEVYANASTDDSSVALDAGTTSLVGTNSVKLAAGDSIATVGGVTTDITTPEITAIYAINNETVDVKFSTPVVMAKQVETATVAGTIAAAGAGNVNVIVTAAGLTGSPLTITAAVANNDTASAIATSIRAALNNNAAVKGMFTIGGTADKVVLTANDVAANDTTLNINIADGTSTGVTAAATSADTTPGFSFNFTASGKATITADVANTSVLSSDDTIIRIKTSAALVSGVTYKGTLLTNASVTDIYNDVAASSSKNNKEFAAPSTANDAPDIASVETTSKSSLKVTFTEDLKVWNSANFTIGGKNIVKFIEFGDTKNVLNIYFDNTNLSSGSIYELKIATGGVTDLVGKATTENLTTDVAVTGNERTKIKISDVVKLEDNQVRVIFNRPIANTAGAITKGILTVSGGPTISTLDAAYLNGSDLDAADYDGANEYVDAIDLTLTANVLSNQTLTFDFSGATYTAMDGAGKDTTTSKTYTGTVSNTQPTVANQTPGSSAVPTAQVDKVTINEAATQSQELTVTFADGNISENVTLSVTKADSAKTIATALKTALDNNAAIAERYTITDNADGSLTTTQKSGFEAALTLSVTLK